MAVCLGKISLLKPTVFRGQNGPKGNTYTPRKTGYPKWWAIILQGSFLFLVQTWSWESRNPSLYVKFHFPHRKNGSFSTSIYDFLPEETILPSPSSPNKHSYQPNHNHHGWKVRKDKWHLWWVLSPRTGSVTTMCFAASFGGVETAKWVEVRWNKLW